MENKKFEQMEIEERENTEQQSVDTAEVEALAKKEREEKKSLKKEKEPRTKKEKTPKEKKPISIDPKKLVTWVGIGALCLVGIISLLSSLLPTAGVSEAILGIVCLALAVSLVMQVVILEAHTQKPEQESGADNSDEADELKARIASLEKELEVQKAIVGALFEFDDYLPKNKKFHDERKRQYEAQTTVYQIKSIMNKATEYEDLEMRGQYINEIDKVLTRFYKNTPEE
ncbi:MAG: hypothetical protein IJZ04_04600 [Clostridia bacterium]|nr:hypothetical protein [Clostridia bacterium]